MVTLERASARHVRALVGDLRADATVAQYAMVERIVARHLSARLGRPPTLADLTADAVRDFVTDARAAGCARETARQYASILKRWGAWMATEYHLERNPLESLQPGKRSTRNVEVLAEDEVARMLDAVGRGRPSVRLRNRATVLVLLDSGLRVSELCALRLDDVLLPAAKGTDGSLRVRHGKGDKARSAPLRGSARALELYIEDERPSLAEKDADSEDYVFLALDGRPWTRQGVLTLIHDLGRRAGIKGKRVSPHTLRATFATIAIMAGNASARVQDALGHADAGTMQHYVSAAELRKQPFRSPLDVWKTVR